ncbi:MAG TPA: VOC family protein [Armatimonadota bacterium]|jgi:methylmalonyl-CoA epimerase
MIGPIDHIAFRVDDLEKALAFYTGVIGLEVADRFEIDFEDGTHANCAALNAGSIQIFISEGVGDGGVVKEWVRLHGNALHHVAYAVPDIHAAVKDLKAKGVEFLSADILEDANLLQIFTKPVAQTGVIHEIIQRKGNKSFSTNNVKRLMESTRG